MSQAAVKQSSAKAFYATVREPVLAGTRSTASSTPVDLELQEYMRQWRRTTAKQSGTAAFMVLHDATLDEICRVQPNSIAQLRTISGIGERKAQMFGESILAALRDYRDGARATLASEKKVAPALETVRLLAEGRTFEEIAKLRERQVGTIVSTVATLVENGRVEFQPHWMDQNRLSVIGAACRRAGVEKITRLKELKDVLPPEITYNEIKLVLAHLRRIENGLQPVSSS